MNAFAQGAVTRLIKVDKGLLIGSLRLGDSKRAAARTGG